MATTVTNNTIQGRLFHWLDNGGAPQSTMIAGKTVVNLTALTGSNSTVNTYKTPIFSAIDQARTNETVVRKTTTQTSITNDFTVA